MQQSSSPGFPYPTAFHPVPFPNKTLALSAHVSPWTIHFRILDKSPVLGPGRGPSSCSTPTQPKILDIKVLVTQSCPTLCDPVDCRSPGSSVHGILQARILEWVAIPFSRLIFMTQGSNLHLLHCWQIVYSRDSWPQTRFFRLEDIWVNILTKRHCWNELCYLVSKSIIFKSC